VTSGPGDPRFRPASRLAAASIAINVILAAASILIGYAAGSTSVVALGFEFAGDVLASALVFTGMLAASRPPDENHPYGHGRIETLAGLAVGAILALGGVGICYRSLLQVAAVHAPPRAHAIWPLIGAIPVRFTMATLKFRLGRRIDSASLQADAWNDVVDILSASAALAALGLTLYDPARFLAADHYGGFAVGLFVIYTGIRVLRDASLDLIDTMPAAALVTRIRDVALATPGVRGIEKLHARKTGLRYHVDLHVEVDPRITVAESHEIAGHVRTRIRAGIPAVADVLVHIEPSSGA
jgi:cation diffusion facilitator family transporter